MIVGYARVSTTEQNIENQLDQLHAAGAERIYSEQGSGIRDDRPQLAACLSELEAGDTLLVVALDRLGRSANHLVQTLDNLRERGIGLRSLRESLDTSTPAGQLVYRIFAAVAEFERDRLVERTQVGLRRARAEGRVGGRPSVMTARRIRIMEDLAADGSTVTEIANTLGVSKATVSRHLQGNAGGAARV